jgi:hypothetical protein
MIGGCGQEVKQKQGKDGKDRLNRLNRFNRLSGKAKGGKDRLNSLSRLNGKGDYSSDDRKEDCLSRGLGWDAKECLPLGL